MNLTQSLLAALIVVLALLTLTTAAQINQASQPWSVQQQTSQVEYQVNDPMLRPQLHATINAPGLKENTVGAR